MDLKGKEVVAHIVNLVKIRKEKLGERGIIPKLAIIRVGERPEDLSYERGIIKIFKEAECNYEVFCIGEDEGEEKTAEIIGKCNKDNNIHGILLFRPLPKEYNQERLENLVDPQKDVDCMGLQNIAHEFLQDGKGYDPCTPRAVMEILDYYKIDLPGKNVVVIGRSMVVGKPLSIMLQKRDATVTMCHRKTKNLEDICKGADIICVAAGTPGILTEDYVKENQVIIDVGINMVDNKLVGDVDYEKVAPKVKAITPVPGGTGTVTTSILLLNTLLAAERINNQ